MIFGSAGFLEIVAFQDSAKEFSMQKSVIKLSLKLKINPTQIKLFYSNKT